MNRVPFDFHRTWPAAWSSLWSRRDLLRIGALGIASRAVPALAGIHARARTAPAPGSAGAKSVILLWMAGGVTHIDSFDPKPDAPAEIRGTLRPIRTALTGIRF